MYLNESIDSTNAYNYAKQVLLLAKKDNWLISRANLIIAKISICSRKLFQI